MSSLAVTDGTAVADWTVWTTQARLVVTDPSVLDIATALVRHRLDEIDLAASRFRPDSEVSVIAGSEQAVHRISPLLRELVGVALDAAEQTHGAVDPTLGAVLTHLGYGAGGVGSGAGTPGQLRAERRTTWRDVHLDEDALRLPPGTLLDLGATAKAAAADRCAAEIADRYGVRSAREPRWRPADLRPRAARRLERPRAGRRRRAGQRGPSVGCPRRGDVVDPAAPVAAPRSADAPPPGPDDPAAGASGLADRHRRRRELPAREHVVHPGDRARSESRRRAREAGVAARLVASDGAVTLVGGWPE